MMAITLCALVACIFLMTTTTRKPPHPARVSRKALDPNAPPAIADGTRVWFVRGRSDPKVHAARILASHHLYSGGHHYVIACPTFPFVIGFANDEELFLCKEAADAEAIKWAEVHRGEQRREQHAQRARIDQQLERLAA